MDAKETLDKLHMILQMDKLDLEFDRLFSTLDQKDLESLGALLNAKEFAALVGHINQKAPIEMKLFPIIVGMSNKQFTQALVKVADKDRQVLRADCLKEIVLHHLTMCAQNFSDQLNQLRKEIEKLQLQIISFQPLELTVDDMLAIEKNLQALTQQAEEKEQFLNQALSFAWKFERADLIEQFSVQKEFLEQQIISTTGMIDEEGKASGLWLLFHQRLNSVYESIAPCDSFYRLPAIEGLQCLSVIYPSDYIEVGLVSKLTEPSTNEQEEALYMLMQAQERLKALKIFTVEDLIKRRIFSKKILTQFLSEEKLKTDRYLSV